MDFMELLKQAKTSIINGSYDEDLFQELSITLLRCIRQFRV